jgi:hypothetical protein
LVFGLGLMILSMLSVLACLDESKMCGDKMDIMDDGSCAPRHDETKDTELTQTPNSDAGADDAGADTEENTEGDGLPKGMDDVCSDSAPCTGEADFCNQTPGEPEGVCTIQGCTLDPDDCPAGYNCFDLSVFLATLPTICQQDK